MDCFEHYNEIPVSAQSRKFLAQLRSYQLLGKCGNIITHPKRILWCVLSPGIRRHIST